MPFVESQQNPYVFHMFHPRTPASSSTGGVPEKAPLDGSKCSQAGSASPEPSAALRTSEAPVETPMLGSTMPGAGGNVGGSSVFSMVFITFYNLLILHDFLGEIRENE